MKTKLSELQEKVFMFYSLENAGDYCVEQNYSYTFEYMSDSIGLSEREVRLACRALTRKGLFQLNYCMDEAGQIQGRRYGVTLEGKGILNKKYYDNR